MGWAQSPRPLVFPHVNAAISAFYWVEQVLQRFGSHPSYNEMTTPMSAVGTAFTDVNSQGFVNGIHRLFGACGAPQIIEKITELKYLSPESLASLNALLIMTSGLGSSSTNGAISSDMEVWAKDARINTPSTKQCPSP